MHIALTHPWCWPWVQRGGERMFADLAEYLSTAGHAVTAVSAAPHRLRSTQGNLTRVVHRALPVGRLRGIDLDQAVTYLPQAALSLHRARPDVVHGMYHLDGVAARLAHARPYVVHIQGMARRSNAAGRPVHRRLLRPSLEGAAAVIAVSTAAAEAVSDEFGIEARAIHNGLFTERFIGAGVEREEIPTILFPGSADDPRKRLDVLLGAMPHVRDRWPDAVVAVAQVVSPVVRKRLTGRVKFLDVAGPADMAATYSRAWVTCLPAVDEAFGLVFLESLAAGRPAVGVADGGVPEVLRERSWLADPDDPESLAAALDRALAAAESPGTVERCRGMSRPFDWSHRGPEFESLYREVTG